MTAVWWVVGALGGMVLCAALGWLLVRWLVGPAHVNKRGGTP